MELKEKQTVHPVTENYILDKFKEIAEKQVWYYAYTMPDNQHFYCLRRDFEQDNEFAFLYNCLSKSNHIEKFKGVNYKYLICGNYKYWYMGCSLNKSDGSPYTILINRKLEKEHNNNYIDIADDYDSFSSKEKYLKEYRDLMNIIRERKILKGNILDIDCGNGLFLDYFPQRIDNYIGVDVCKKFIDKCKIKYRNNIFILENFDNFYIKKKFNTLISLYASASLLNFKYLDKYLQNKPNYFLVFYKKNRQGNILNDKILNYADNFNLSNSKIISFNKYEILTNG